MSVGLRRGLFARFTASWIWLRGKQISAPYGPCGSGCDHASESQERVLVQLRLVRAAMYVTLTLEFSALSKGVGILQVVNRMKPRCVLPDLTRLEGEMRICGKPVISLPVSMSSSPDRRSTESGLASHPLGFDVAKAKFRTGFLWINSRDKHSFISTSQYGQIHRRNPPTCLRKSPTSSASSRSAVAKMLPVCVLPC